MFKNLVAAGKSHLGRLLISVILGLGAASLFRNSYYRSIYAHVDDNVRILGYSVYSSKLEIWVLRLY